MGNIGGGGGGRINTGILGVKGLSRTRVGHIFNYKNKRFGLEKMRLVRYLLYLWVQSEGEDFHSNIFF